MTPKRDKRNEQYLNNGNVNGNKSLIQKVFERRKETNIAIMSKESQKVLDRIVDGKIMGAQTHENGTPNMLINHHQYQLASESQQHSSDGSMLGSINKREKQKATELANINSDNQLKDIKRVNPSPSVGTLPQAQEMTPIQKNLPESKSSAAENKYTLLGA